MQEVYLKNFRCFRNEQTARLAPLTLLVGENSTGKTSFLALLRALLYLSEPFTPEQHSLSLFNTPPYDLGSFDEIAHHRGVRGPQSCNFEVGFMTRTIGDMNLIPKDHPLKNHPIELEFTFTEKSKAPAIIRRRVTIGDTWVEFREDSDGTYRMEILTHQGRWTCNLSATQIFRSRVMNYQLPDLLSVTWSRLRDSKAKSGDELFVPLNGSATLSDSMKGELDEFCQLVSVSFGNYLSPWAGAPVRSKPKRTYDPMPLPQDTDSQGGDTPVYLSGLSSDHPDLWNRLKDDLQRFGASSGLFDELSIRHLGDKQVDPFQVQVRKSGSKRHKGPMRNLVDVGYGVSQILPVITDLMQPPGPSPSLFLMQQPEVHLHPMAQAALGSLFCQIASWDRQLIVETHSDHIINRIRMDVRDRSHEQDSTIDTNDLSILYFERSGLDCEIHNLRLDSHGNLEGAPSSYRHFFMEETTRSLGL